MTKIFNDLGDVLCRLSKRRYKTLNVRDELLLYYTTEKL